MSNARGRGAFLFALAIAACGSSGDALDASPKDAGGATDARMSSGTDGPADASSDGSSPLDDASSGDAAGAIDSGDSGDAGSCSRAIQSDLLGGCSANGFSAFSWTCRGTPYSVVFSIIGGANGYCQKQNKVSVPSGAGPSPFSRCQQNVDDAVAIATSYCGFPPPVR